MAQSPYAINFARERRRVEYPITETRFRTETFQEPLPTGVFIDPVTGRETQIHPRLRGVNGGQSFRTVTRQVPYEVVTGQGSFLPLRSRLPYAVSRKQGGFRATSVLGPTP